MPPPPPFSDIFFFYKNEVYEQKIILNEHVICLKMLEMAILDIHLVWLFAINRTTIPRIYSCSELVCAIVDLGIVGLSVMCAHCGHNLFIYLCKT